jgi:putative transposase
MSELKSASNAVYEIQLHIVFVVKYRRQVLTETMLKSVAEVLRNGLESWRCELIEVGGEADHLHLLIGIHPALNISELIGNLKAISSRHLRKEYAAEIKQYLWKDAFWHRAYYVGSVGKTTLETIKRYVQNQGTGNKPGRPRRQPRPAPES